MRTFGNGASLEARVTEPEGGICGEGNLLRERLRKVAHALHLQLRRLDVFHHASDLLGEVLDRGAQVKRAETERVVRRRMILLVAYSPALDRVLVQRVEAPQQHCHDLAS